MFNASSLQRPSITTLLAGAYDALSNARRGQAVVSSYRNLPPHVLRDIGFEQADVESAAERPSAANATLAESWRRRAWHLARRELPGIDD